MQRTMLKSKIDRAAARLVHRGDTIIIISYAGYEPDEIPHHRPRVVHVDAHNRILVTDENLATLATAAPEPAAITPLA